MLEEILEKYFKECDLNQLSFASHQLSEKYRQVHSHYANSFDLKNAYLAARMPATLEAIKKVLSIACHKDINPKSILDLGSGPGTTVWAAREFFRECKYTLIEKDFEFIELAKKFLQQTQENFHCIHDNFLTYLPNTHDLTLFSYSLGELSKDSFANILHKYWQASNNTLIIIEPGTTRGFETILKARTILIDLGAHIVAPCPHSHVCSLRKNPKDAKDWCHFSVRVERSFFHKYAKEASLPYEDEKFSYIIASKNQTAVTRNRILRPPLKRTGHVNFTLCTSEGLTEKTISKKTKEIYKNSKKLDWGDELSEEPSLEN